MTTAPSPEMLSIPQAPVLHAVEGGEALGEDFVGAEFFCFVGGGDNVLVAKVELFLINPRAFGGNHSVPAALSARLRSASQQLTLAVTVAPLPKTGAAGPHWRWRGGRSGSGRRMRQTPRGPPGSLLYPSPRNDYKAFRLLFVLETSVLSAWVLTGLRV